jgi:hypothetical protein
MKNPVEVIPEFKYPPAKTTDAERAKYEWNAIHLCGKTWSEAVSDFCSEMEALRAKEGMKSWEFWGTKGH